MHIELSNKYNCCGCTACENACPKGCISMKEDNEGFLYPEVEDSNCIDCGLCIKVCPILNYIKENESIFIYAAKNKSSKIQKESSSGGLFFSLCQFIIEKKGYVYGAAYNEKFEVYHTSSNNMDGCKIFHGAKYVQSKIESGLFKEIRRLLELRVWILFSGTPCQVAGLKSFLKKDYSTLILCDLICHSVASPKLFRDYIKFVQRSKKLESINMRWKLKGWEKSTIQLKYKDDSEIIGKGDARLWHDISTSGIVSRPSCYKCRFTNFNRVGDFTIGDFWGVKKSHPSFYDSNGVSLLMINSEKGRLVFDDIAQSLEFQISSKESCIQPRLQKPSEESSLRGSFWKDYSSHCFEMYAKSYFHYGIINQKKLKLNNILRKMYHKILRVI